MVKLSEKKMTFTPKLLAPVFYDGEITSDVATSFIMSEKMERQARKHGFDNPFYGLAGQAWIVEIDDKLICVTGEEAKKFGYREKDTSLIKQEKNGKIHWLKHDETE